MSIPLRPSVLAPHFPTQPRISRYFHGPKRCIKPPPRQHFHTTRSLCDDTVANPYDVLGLKPSATAAEIKKQFYDLSKTYHPDRNPNNQEEASRKFVAISGAYHIIGDATKRENFDREQQRHYGGHPSSAPGPSYTAGARRASGLSRRRTHFRGPPPSFYRNGAWGETYTKRSGHAETGGAHAHAYAQGQQQQTSTGAYAGTTGSWPFNTDPNDVPHFDRDGHYKTTSTVEEQLRKGRNKRRRVFQEAEDDMMNDDSAGNLFGRFFMVGSALIVGVVAPIFIFSGGPRGGLG